VAATKPKFPCEAAKNELRELRDELAVVQNRLLASMDGLDPLDPQQQAVADGMFEMIVAVRLNHIEPMLVAWEAHRPRYVSTEAILERMERQARK